MIVRISNARPDITDQLLGNLGRVIELEGGLDYVCSAPIKAPPAPGRYTEIRGEGEYHTRIRMQGGGFHAQSVMKFRDLSIWRADQPRTPGDWGDPTFGIFAEARISTRDVSIDGFTIGLRIWADGRSRGTMANRCRITHTTISGAGLQGLQVRGRDANACTFDGVAIYSAGEHGKFFVERDQRLLEEAILSGAPLPTDLLGPPCGVYEHSFFGNAHIARLVASSCETLLSLDADGNPNTDGYGRRILDGLGHPITDKNGAAVSVRVEYAPIIFDGDSNHSGDFAPYHESDQGSAQYDQGVVSIAGLANGWESSNKQRAQHGLRIDGASINALDVVNDLDPDNKTLLRLGRNAGGGSFFALSADRVDASRPLRAKATPAIAARGNTPAFPGGYLFDLANGAQKVGLIRQDGKIYAYRGSVLIPLNP